MSETKMPPDRMPAPPGRRVFSTGSVLRTQGIIASIDVNGTGGLRDVRSAVLDTAAAARLPEERIMDMALAANEIATNSLLHGGGRARVRINIDRDGWHCDVIDEGPGLGDSAAGTQPPGVQQGGFGMWIARRLCDEFQVIPSDKGLHIRLTARPS